MAPAPSKQTQVPTPAPVDPKTPVVPPTKPTPETPKPPVVPAPPKEAVTKGSFTVWANPPNPKMFESYNIHVRVKLPSNTTTYSRLDLIGTLFGTDGYQQKINDPLGMQQFKFIPGSGYAELIMPIPGASGGVSDTLTVNSKLITESQTITIVFGNSQWL